jgi:hypothetical protein
MQRARRKALIRYHPDKAQREGKAWQKVVECEEIYKLIQIEWDKVRQSRTSEKDAKLAQKLGQLRLHRDFPQEFMGQLASFGPT